MSLAGHATPTVTISAIVYPPCQCGAPWPTHPGPHGCPGYRPSRPVQDHGAVAYLTADPVAQALWWLESRVRALRSWWAGRRAVTASQPQEN